MNILEMFGQSTCGLLTNYYIPFPGSFLPCGEEDNNFALVGGAALLLVYKVGSVFWRSYWNSGQNTAPAPGPNFVDYAYFQGEDSDILPIRNLHDDSEDLNIPPSQNRYDDSRDKEPAPRFGRVRVPQGLHENAAAGILNEVMTLLEADPERINDKGPDGETPLTAAAKNGHINTFKYLIEQGADPNIPGKDNKTALFYACETKNAQLVQKLEEADPNIANSRGMTPLMIASKNGGNAAANLLISFFGDTLELDRVGNDGKTALHHAAREYPFIVNLLLLKRANPDIADRNGDYPIHCAAKESCTQALRHLVSRMENPNVKNEEGNTALHILVSEPAEAQVDACKVLLANDNVNPNEVNAEGDAPIHLACYAMQGNFELVELLLGSEKVDSSIQNKDGKTPFHILTDFELPAAEKSKLADLLQKIIETGQVQLEDCLRVAYEKMDDLLMLKILDKQPKETLEKLQLEGVPLILWAATHFRGNVVEVLNRKGIYLEAEKDTLTEGLERVILTTIESFNEKSPVRVREVRLLAEALRDKDAVHEGGASEKTFLLDTFEASLEVYVQKILLQQTYRQQGIRTDGMELFMMDTLGFTESFRSRVGYMPKLVQQFLLDPNLDRPEIKAVLSKMPSQMQTLLLQKELNLADFVTYMDGALAMQGAAADIQVKMMRARQEERAQHEVLQRDFGDDDDLIVD